MPILSKAGCNAAACHGGAAGRGGFRLSLFGGDPEFDYRTIVHELSGRRINIADPAQSLLLLKPTGALEHGGKRRLTAGSDEVEKISVWIADGSPRLRSRRLLQLQIDPSEISVASRPEKRQLQVVANFDDAAKRDVTSLAIYSSSDESAVDVATTGNITVLRPGRHTVLVQFGNIIRPVEVTSPIGDELIDLSAAPRLNWIDDEILATLQSLRLPPSPQADDAMFLRRIYFDLTGRLPPPDDLVAFMAEKSPYKRALVIDRILNSDAFVQYWTYRLAIQFRIRPTGNDMIAATAMQDWLQDQLRRGAGWDDMASSLLLATGDTHQEGAATYYRLPAGPREQAEYVSESLMGVRLRCANCHNHPLDRWTQDDYHGLAQIFARIERGREVKLLDSGEVTHPRTGEAAIPRIPGGAVLDASDDGRQQLAAWLTRSDNPYFAKAMVNRIWNALMGRGLVEPVDDIRATNPASNPPLLQRLADDFIQHDYDIRHTIRLICTSAAYARSSKPLPANQSDRQFYSHALTRPLEAEVLADAIADATGIRDDFGENYSQETRAIELIDPKAGNDTLSVLGRCDRDQSCESASGGATGIATKLHLLNGPLLNRRLSHSESVLQQAITAGKADEQIVRDLYLRFLSRPIKRVEREFWTTEMAKSGDSQQRKAILEDMTWSLLNSQEFMTNH